MECEKCNSTWDSDLHCPHILPCGHTLCLSCINSAVSLSTQNKEVMCPVCGKNHTILKSEKMEVNFPRNQRLLNLAEKVTSQNSKPMISNNSLSMSVNFNSSFHNSEMNNKSAREFIEDIKNNFYYPLCKMHKNKANYYRIESGKSVFYCNVCVQNLEGKYYSYPNLKVQNNQKIKSCLIKSSLLRDEISRIFDFLTGYQRTFEEENSHKIEELFSYINTIVQYNYTTTMTVYNQCKNEQKNLVEKKIKELEQLREELEKYERRLKEIDGEMEAGRVGEEEGEESKGRKIGDSYRMLSTSKVHSSQSKNNQNSSYNFSRLESIKNNSYNKSSLGVIEENKENLNDSNLNTPDNNRNCGDKFDSSNLFSDKYSNNERKNINSSKRLSNVPSSLRNQNPPQNSNKFDSSDIFSDKYQSNSQRKSSKSNFEGLKLYSEIKDDSELNSVKNKSGGFVGDGDFEGKEGNKEVSLQMQLEDIFVKLGNFINYENELNLFQMNLSIKEEMKDALFDFIQNLYEIDIDFLKMKDGEIPTIKNLLNKEGYWECSCGEIMNKTGKIICTKCSKYRPLESYSNIIFNPLKITETEYTELNLRRKHEAQVFQNLLKAPENEDEFKSFAVNKEWFSEWKAFVSNDLSDDLVKNDSKRISDNKLVGVLPPGEIDNECVVEGIKGLTRKTHQIFEGANRNLFTPTTNCGFVCGKNVSKDEKGKSSNNGKSSSKEKGEYILVNELLWEWLLLNYGGGPEISEEEINLLKEGKISDIKKSQGAYKVNDKDNNTLESERDIKNSLFNQNTESDEKKEGKEVRETGDKNNDRSSGKNIVLSKNSITNSIQHVKIHNNFSTNSQNNINNINNINKKTLDFNNCSYGNNISSQNNEHFSLKSNTNPKPKEHMLIRMNISDNNENKENINENVGFPNKKAVEMTPKLSGDSATNKEKSKRKSGGNLGSSKSKGNKKSGGGNNSSCKLRKHKDNVKNLISHKSPKALAPNSSFHTLLKNKILSEKENLAAFNINNTNTSILNDTTENIFNTFRKLRNHNDFSKAKNQYYYLSFLCNDTDSHFQSNKIKKMPLNRLYSTPHNNIRIKEELSNIIQNSYFNLTNKSTNNLLLNSKDTTTTISQESIYTSTNDLDSRMCSNKIYIPSRNNTKTFSFVLVDKAQNNANKFNIKLKKDFGRKQTNDMMYNSEIDSELFGYKDTKKFNYGNNKINPIEKYHFYTNFPNFRLTNIPEVEDEYNNKAGMSLSNYSGNVSGLNETYNNRDYGKSIKNNLRHVNHPCKNNSINLQCKSNSVIDKKLKNITIKI